MLYKTMSEPKEQFKEKEWRCTVCDYVYVGNELPDQCPKCGADKKAFVLVEEEGIKLENGKQY